MTDCLDCIRARVNPRTSRFTARCLECSARGLAQAPQFHESMSADAITPRYRDALQMIFGGDWMAGHQKCKEWAERLKQ